MNNVEIWKVYRHFKGNYYFVENKGKDSETLENIIIYKALYDKEGSLIYTSSEKRFLEEVDVNRPDNITKQKHRFELVDLNNKEDNLLN